MNQAKLYQQVNDVQRHDGKKIIEEFSSILQWRFDGTDSLIDVGTGTGDVLIDFLYPIMPRNFKKITGFDISSEMVKYCKKNYSHIEKVDFRILDVTIETLPRELIGEFDHVTSFYCLHWVQNQRKALQNIYNMLKMNGDCVLAFLATNTIFDCYNIISKNPKWMPYMKDVKRFITPLYFWKDPQSEYKQYLSEAGFSYAKVEIRNKIFDHENRQSLKECYRPINPFLERMSSLMQDEFLEEITDTAICLNSFESKHGRYSKFIIKYKLIVAYAKKQ